MCFGCCWNIYLEISLFLTLFFALFVVSLFPTLPPPHPPYPTSLVLRRRVLDSERAELLDPSLSLDDLALPHGVLHAPVARCNEALAAVFRLCFQRWTGRPLEYLGESVSGDGNRFPVSGREIEKVPLACPSL